MQKIFLLIVFVSWACLAAAQNTFWADRVIDFSSEYFSIEFSAKQVLGKPDALPSKVESDLAWSPRYVGRQEFIQVGFERSLPISQIAIAETANSGSLHRAFAYSPDGNEFLLIEFPNGLRNTNGGMFNIFFPLTGYPVSALKLIFDGSRIEGRINIDAIAISDSPFPVRANPFLHPRLRSNMEVEKLDEKINSSAKEGKPALSPDHKYLFFSRENHLENIGGIDDPGDIWVSEYNPETDTWSEAHNAGSPLNNKGQNFVSSFSPQGENLIAVLGNAYTKTATKAGISLSFGENGKWSSPVPQEFVANEELKGDFDLFLSTNRKMMIIANQGQISYGGKDISVSFLQNDGLWSDPVNLGPMVNTLNEESSPFLLPDGRTLYFSSNGRAGYGKRDIYVTHRLDNNWTKWSEPQNLGPRINTPFDESDFTISTIGGYAYFSRDEGSNSDLFRVKLPLFEDFTKQIVFRGEFVDQVTKEPVNAKIEMRDSTYIQEGKNFAFKLTKGKNYRFLIEASGYKIKEEGIQVEAETKEIVRTFLLAPLGEEIHTFESITFASNDSTINAESYIDLEKILLLMLEQPDIKIEISSHTDALGLEQDNLNLSKARAAAIRSYLITKGIFPQRLTTQWHGESRPIATNDTEEGRKKNRRVEFRVIRD